MFDRATTYPVHRDALLAWMVSGSGLAPAIRVAAVLAVTALTVAAAQVSVPLPFTPVPFTFQPMFVLVSGAALGARLGMTSQLVYLGLGIVGLPVFAASPLLPQGAARLMGPTAGYLLSYPFAAYLVGHLAERHLDRRYVPAVLSMGAGLALIFMGGVTWLAFLQPGALGLSAVQAALNAGFYPFVVPDLLKLLVAAGLLPGIWHLVGPRQRT